MITRGIHIMKKTLAVLITACSLSLGLTPALTGISGNLVIEAEAHPGRTDANGGHRDNKNVSGLGSYHYHYGIIIGLIQYTVGIKIVIFSFYDLTTGHHGTAWVEIVPVSI